MRRVRLVGLAGIVTLGVLVSCVPPASVKPKPAATRTPVTAAKPKPTLKPKPSVKPLIASTLPDWTTPQADSAMTGSNPAEKTITAATISRLTEQWRAPNPAYVGYVTTPLVSKGLVVYSESFVRDVTTDPDQFSQEDVTRVAAYDLMSGTRRWAVIVTGVERLTGITDNVALTAGQSRGGAFIHAFDLATGRKVWSWVNPDEVDTREPILAQGRLVVPGGEDAYVLDPATGHQLFTLSCTEADGIYCPFGANAGIAAEGSKIFAGGRQMSATVQFAASSGSRQIIVPPVRYTTFSYSPMVHDGVLYVTQSASPQSQATGQVSAYKLAGCTTASCPPLWSVLVPEYLARLAYADGTVFARGQHSVRALDAATGRQLWTSGSPFGFDSSVYPAVVVAGGLVYINSGHTLSAYRATGCGAATCEPLWTQTFPGQIDPSYYDAQMSPPVITGGRLIFADTNGLHVLGLG
jgi:outer membrane protein assembly factor BamB